MTTAKDLQNKILTKAAEDDDFRARLMSDPTSAIETELGVKMPENFTVNIHQDAESEVNLVLPPKQKLTEEDLGSVTGGYDDDVFQYD